MAKKQQDDEQSLDTNAEDNVSLNSIIGVNTSSDDEAGKDDAKSVEPEEEEEAAEGVSGTEEVDESSVNDDTDAGDSSEKIVQNDDGTFSFGKYKASSMEELVFEVNKARSHAEKLASKKGLFSNPFLESNDTTGDVLDEFADEAYLDDEYTSSVANAVVERLQPQSVLGLDGEIRQILKSEQYTQDDAERMLGHVLQNDPHNEVLQNELIRAIGAFDHFRATDIQANLIAARMQFQQQQAFEAQQAQQAQLQAQQAAHVTAFQEATKAFYENTNDVSNYIPQIQEWFNNPAHKSLIEAARGNKAAMYANYTNAYAYAKLQEAQAGNVNISQNNSVVHHNPIHDGGLESGGENNLDNTPNEPTHETLASILGMRSVK